MSKVRFYLYAKTCKHVYDKFCNKKQLYLCIISCFIQRALYFNRIVGGAEQNCLASNILNLANAIVLKIDRNIPHSIWI